jgi:group I intron endonuclease
MLHICGVYKIINTLNDHCYVGSSHHIQGRIYEHFHMLRHGDHDNVHIQNAYNKYGEVFDVELLKECQSEELLYWEQYYIDTLKPEYNILPKAGTTLGCKRNQEFKEYRLGNKYGLGYHFTDEQKENSSIAHMGHIVTEQTRIRIGNAQRGKHVSSETREKLRQSHIGKDNHQRKVEP